MDNSPKLTYADPAVPTAKPRPRLDDRIALVAALAVAGLAIVTVAGDEVSAHVYIPTTPLVVASLAFLLMIPLSFGILVHGFISVISGRRKWRNLSGFIVAVTAWAALVVWAVQARRGR
jgi:hypothetical protein